MCETSKWLFFSDKQKKSDYSLFSKGPKCVLKTNFIKLDFSNDRNAFTLPQKGAENQKKKMQSATFIYVLALFYFFTHKAKTNSHQKKMKGKKI